MENKSPIIYGDGEQNRDFVNVQVVVEANLCALTKANIGGEVFNVCSGIQCSVNRLFEIFQKVSGKAFIDPIYKENRVGDINKSIGDNSKSLEKLGFEAKIGLEKGIKEVF